MADKSKDIIKVQLNEPMRFIGVTYRNMGEGLLQDQKVLRESRAVVAHAFNPSTQEAEAGGSL